jgi:hypothetical protein
LFLVRRASISAFGNCEWQWQRPGIVLQVFMIRGSKSNDFAGALRASSNRHPDRTPLTRIPGMCKPINRRILVFFLLGPRCVKWLIRPANRNPAQERFHATFF